jgi:hypothetical protein
VDRLDRLAPLSGLIFAVLFGVGSAIWGLEQPARNAGTDEVVSFYENSSTEILIGGMMSIVSVLFLVWFGAVLREHLAAAERTERSGLPLLAFAGTVLTAAVGLGAETINMAGALSADDGQLTGDTAEVYFDVSYALGGPSAGIAIAMIAAPTALTALRTGRLLRPIAAWALLLVALTMVTPAMLTGALPFLFGVFILLVAALSLRFYREGSQGSDERLV